MIVEIKELGVEFVLNDYDDNFELFIKSIRIYLMNLNIDKSSDKHRLKTLVLSTHTFKTFKYYGYTFLIIKK